MCELLLQNGAKVNWKNLRGNTAISMAIEQNHVDCVQLLFDYGAEIDIAAVNEIRTRTQKKISSKIDELVLSAGQKREKAKEEEKTTAIVQSPLFAAVQSGNVETVQVFLEQMAQKAGKSTAHRRTNTLDHTTSQSILVQQRRLSVNPPSAVTVEEQGLVQMVNELDSEGQTALFQAAGKGYLDICRLLIEAGIDINFRDKANRSALHMSIAGNQYATTKMLLEAGANTTGVDMKSIRFWSMSNISQRIDQLLKKYPVCLNSNKYARLRSCSFCI